MALSEAQKKKLSKTELNRYNSLNKRYSDATIGSDKELAELNSYLKKAGARSVTQPAAKPSTTKGGVKLPTDKYDGLNSTQNKLVNQTTQGDLAITTAANNQLDQVNQNFSTPFDFSSLPQAPTSYDFSNVPQGPVTGDYNQWRQQQIDLTNQAFDNRNNDAFKSQEEDFRQRMADQGIPEDSEKFQKLYKQQITQPQSDARIQAQAQAMSQASGDASQFANVGFTAHTAGMTDAATKYSAEGQAYNDAYARQLQQRNQALGDYNALKGSASGAASNAIQFSQGLESSDRNTENSIKLAKATPHGGGGVVSGGGGGGGFDLNSDPSYQRWLAQQQYSAANAPSQPSYGSQLLGSIGGAFAGGLAQSLGKNMFGS